MVCGEKKKGNAPKKVSVHALCSPLTFACDCQTNLHINTIV